MSPLRAGLVRFLVMATLAAGLATVTRWPPGPFTVDAAAGIGAASGNSPASGVLPVSSRTLVCPDSSALAGGASTDVTLVAPDLLPLSGSGIAAPATSGSRASAQPLGPDATPLVVLTEQGPAKTAAVAGADVGPVVVRAVGALAAGLFASQVGTAAEGDATGVTGTSCAEPSTEAWFLGMGTELGHRPRLSLVNAERAVAEVDVSLYGPDGRLDIADLRGVVVAPGAVQTFELDAVAPDLTQLAVEVTVRSGRVAAAVRDSRSEGLDSLGVDWVARSVSPASRVVVPGVTGGGQLLLQLLAPGELDTRVRVRLWTRTGPIVPVGMEEVELVAGEVGSVDLAAVGSEVTAVELTADQPVVAGLRAVTSGTEQREMSYTAGAAPLTGPAVVADVRSGAGWAGRLVLSADDGGPDGAAFDTVAEPASGRVLVRFVDAASGRVLRIEQPVIPIGSTVEVDLTGDDLPERFSVVVTPVAGVVYGALALQRSGGPDAGITILPLASPQLVVEVPAVHHDLLTVLPGRG